MPEHMALPAAGLLEACDDPNLLGVPLWPKQRELLAEVEAGPRMHVWAMGRRSGKTTSAALVGLWSCLLRPELIARLGIGQRGYAVAVATNLAQARRLLADARSIVERSPLLHDLVEAATEDEIRFATGTAFAAFPCTARGVRGWPIFTVILDEAAHFQSETEGPAVADRVFEALVPSTAQFGDLARVVVASTPYGVGNLFADLFQRATSGELADALAQHATTAEANPTVEAEFLDRERARDPEGFEQEYAASFLAGGSSFLEPERIAAVVAERDELPPSHGRRWIAGLDPAFSSDPFGLAIVGTDAQVSDGRLVLGLARRWTPPKRKARSLEEERAIEDAVLDEVAAECLRYGARVVTDQFKAAGVADYLRRKGVSVRTEAMTAPTKTAVFKALRARIYLEALELYDVPALVAELRRLRTRYTAGQAAVVNPRVGGSHGDIAQALALAVWEHDRHGMSVGRSGGPTPQGRRGRDWRSVEYERAMKGIRPGMTL